MGFHAVFGARGDGFSGARSGRSCDVSVYGVVVIVVRAARVDVDLAVRYVLVHDGVGYERGVLRVVGALFDERLLVPDEVVYCGNPRCE